MGHYNRKLCVSRVTPVLEVIFTEAKVRSKSGQLMYSNLKLKKRTKK